MVKVAALVRTAVVVAVQWMLQQCNYSLFVSRGV